MSNDWFCKVPGCTGKCEPGKHKCQSCADSGVQFTLRKAPKFSAIKHCKKCGQAFNPQRGGREMCCPTCRNTAIQKAIELADIHGVNKACEMVGINTSQYYTHIRLKHTTDANRVTITKSDVGGIVSVAMRMSTIKKQMAVLQTEYDTLKKQYDEMGGSDVLQQLIQ